MKCGHCEEDIVIINHDNKWGANVGGFKCHVVECRGGVDGNIERNIIWCVQTWMEEIHWWLYVGETFRKILKGNLLDVNAFLKTKCYWSCWQMPKMKNACCSKSRDSNII